MTDDGDLTTYLVERYWPGVTEAGLAAALERASPSSGGPGGGHLRHVHSVLIPSEEVVFSLFEAHSAADVEEANRRAEAPFERVVEAVAVRLGTSGRAVR